MPNALIQYMGYLIYFWGGDGSEPVHVHVSKSKQKNATKFWVTSEGIELANDTGSVDKKDIKAILAYLRANRESIIMSWVEFFGKAELKR